MRGFDLDSPVVRIAAATGEEPVDVEAAIAALLADGYSFDHVWTIISNTVESGGSVVDVVAQLLN